MNFTGTNAEGNPKLFCYTYIVCDMQAYSFCKRILNVL